MGPQDHWEIEWCCCPEAEIHDRRKHRPIRIPWMLESGISAGMMVSSVRAASAQLAGEDSATLVCGEDRHHHFMPEPQPTRDPEFVALHRTPTECRARILDRGTGVASYNEAKVLRSAAEPARSRVGRRNIEVAFISGLCYFVKS
jgi:hypothetical protein